MNQEATETVVIPVSPVLLTPESGTRRHSTGKANTSILPSLSTSDEKLLPNYLRASTGSCHDFCKYGRKHAFEPKKRSPIFSRPVTSKEYRDKGRDHVKVSARVERRRSLHKLKPEPQQMTERNEQSNLIKKNVPSAVEDFEIYEHGAGVCQELVSIMTKTPSSPQNSISSSEHRFSDQAEGHYRELIRVELMEPLSIEKSIVTEELIVQDQAEGYLEEPGSMELAGPSPSQRSIASGESLGIDKSEEIFEGLVDMDEETAQPPSQESLLIEQEQGSCEAPLRGSLKDTLPLQEFSMYADEEPGNQSKVPSKESVSRDIVSSRRKPVNRAIRSFQGPEDVTVRRQSFIKESIASAQGNDLENKSNRLRSVKTNEMSKREVIKLRSISNLKNEMPVKPRSFLRKGTGSPGKSSSTRQKSPIQGAMVSVQPKVVKQKGPASVKKTSPVGTAKIKTKISPPSRIIDISARGPALLKTKAPVAKSDSPATASRIKQNKISRSLDLSKIGEKKVLKPPRASSSPKPTATRVPSMKLGKYGNKNLTSPVKSARKETKNSRNQVKENTLCNIEPEQDIKSLVQTKPRNYKSSLSSRTSSVTPSQSSTSSSSWKREGNEDIESEYSEMSESASENDGALDNKQKSNTRKTDGKRILRSASSHLEDKGQVPHKLKFRRGKVIDPQSENTGPRRLRFRRARVIAENQNGRGETGRRSFGKRSELIVADSNGTTMEAPTVVLRHQDQQEKKDTQGLFNHVIEETASKLVETRKSKVKALVGAFETVISLQESKAAPTF